MVTNACYNLLNGLNPYKALKSFTDTRDLYHPLLDNCFSGLLLFEQNITEDVNNILLPANSKAIGHAASFYYGSDLTQGTLNTTETVDLNNGKRYVWDFPTDRGNGTIRSVGLTSQVGGNMGLSISNVDETGKVLIADANVSTKNMQPFRGNCNYLTVMGGARIIGMSKENEFIFALSGLGGNTVTFTKYSLSNLVGLRTNRTILKKEKTVTSKLKLCNSFNFQMVGGKLYSILSYNTNKFDVVIFNADTFEIISEDTYTIQDASFVDLGSQESYFNALVYDEHFLIFNATRSSVYKINMNDISDYSLIEGSLTSMNALYGWRQNIIGDRVLFFEAIRTNYKGYSTSYCYDGKELYFTPGTQFTQASVTPGKFYFLNSSYVKSPYLVAGRLETADIYFFIWTPFLSTINKLSTPVVKNETQTMKVTYEITEI